MNDVESVRRAIQDLKAALGRNLNISEEAAAVRRAPGKWSRKEILGHLIDSAANNHQRIIRAQIEDNLAFPGYEQDRWVALQDCHGARWSDLVALWRAYNTHLVRVMDRVPVARYEARVTIGTSAPVTLGWLIVDYARHLNHHLGQLFERPGAMAVSDLIKPWHALGDRQREAVMAVIRKRSMATLEDSVRGGILGDMTLEVIAAMAEAGEVTVHFVLDAPEHVTETGDEHWMLHVWTGEVSFLWESLRDGSDTVREGRRRSFAGTAVRIEKADSKTYDWNAERRRCRIMKEHSLRGIEFREDPWL